MSFITCKDLLIGKTSSPFLDAVIKKYCNENPELVLQCWVILQLKKKMETGEVPKNVQLPSVDCPKDLMNVLEYYYEKIKEHGRVKRYR